MYHDAVSSPVASGGAGPTPPFSFVHAADLHLDSPFQGVTAQDPAVAELLRRATFDAFDALVALCIDREADFLLVAGDVFDAADRSLRAQLRFFDGLQRLAERGIPSFVVHGNHDPLEGWSHSLTRPPLVTVFGAHEVETAPVVVGGMPVADVSGISYLRRQEGRNLAALFPARPSPRFRIGLLHANCGGDPRHEAYAPCSLEDLSRAGVDYWALGHVHERAVLRRDPLVVYPGNTQGLSIREPGPRGCFLVRVDEHRHAELEFCPLDAVRWQGGEVSIAGHESVTGLDAALAALVRTLGEEAGRPAVARLRVVGRGPLCGELSRRNTVADLLERARQTGLAADPVVWVQELEPACRPEADLEQRRRVDDLLGRVLRIAADLRAPGGGAGAGDGASPATALAPALAELFENARAERVLGRPDTGELLRLLAQAELLCLDLLEPR